MVVEVVNIDAILQNLGGFGKYQFRRWCLFIFTTFALSQVELSYIFSTINFKYRCLVPSCESRNSTTLQADWLRNAIPFKNDQPEKCERYELLPNGTECGSASFNTSSVQTCDEFVFESTHTSIMTDFKLFCGDKLWMVTLPSSIHFVALFIALPFVGLLADRFGRKIMVVMGLLIAAILNIIKSFSTSYWMFLALEFVQALCSGGVYGCIFTLCVETLESKRRVLGAILVFLCISVGESTIALVAWNIESWRNLLRITSIPALLIVLYAPFMPESIRWLVSKQKFDRANRIFEIIAEENNVPITDKDLIHHKEVTVRDKSEASQPTETLMDVFKNSTMLFRLFCCIICWITCLFVFYGLILTSGQITGNRYLNFILVACAEIPGNLVTYFSCTYIGRKHTLSASLIAAGLCCGSFIFINNGHWLRLVLFLVGKSAITTSISSVYIITAELYPTPFRQTLMGVCSMVGRIGGIMAPQMPHLAVIWSELPILAFSLSCMIAGVLSLTFPETLNSTLPTTIGEAVHIGAKSKPEKAEMTKF